MPASYHLVPGNLWSHTFRPLSKPAKLLALYLWTSPLRITEGLFVQPVGYIALDTGLTDQQVHAAFGELEKAGLFKYDPDAELVLDTGALKASPLRHKRDADGNIAVRKDGSLKLDKRVVPAVRKVRQLPESPLKAEFVRLAWEHSPDLAEALGDLPLKAPMEGATKGAREAPMEGAIRDDPIRDEPSTSKHDDAAASECRCGANGKDCICPPAEPQAEPEDEDFASRIRQDHPWLSVSGDRL